VTSSASSQTNPAQARAWTSLHADAARIALLPSRAERMHAFIQLVWKRLGGTGISWVGFYCDDPSAAVHERLTLAAREPKPACSPIGLHGACGQTLTSARPMVVYNVRDLGEGYIACDPRDQSELILPCFAADGTVWGVLDFDSHEIGSFCTNDAHAGVYLLRLAGLSA
jgi:putative methionine-R-sulfoxide reductase with GAF domain